MKSPQINPKMRSMSADATRSPDARARTRDLHARRGAKHAARLRSATASLAGGR